MSEDEQDESQIGAPAQEQEQPAHHEQPQQDIPSEVVYRTRPKPQEQEQQPEERSE